MNKNFYIVNQFLWEWFMINYGGGPEIQIPENLRKVINEDENRESLMVTNSNNSIIIIGDGDCCNKHNENLCLNNYVTNKKFENDKDDEINKKLRQRSYNKTKKQNNIEKTSMNKYCINKFTDIKISKKLFWDGLNKNY